MKRRALLIGLLAALPGAARAAPPIAAPAAAAPAVAVSSSLPSHQTMTYAVYAGGINALATTLTIVIDAAGRYDVTLATQTHGLLGHLAPWHGTFEAKGLRPQAGAVEPLDFRGVAVWRDGVQDESFSYSPDGKLATHKVLDHDKDKSPPLDHALADGTTDALSATLAMLDGVTAGRPCAPGPREVYDGLRRYKLVFHDEGHDMLQDSQFASYKGQAERCTAQVVPDGGKWHDKPRGWLNIQEQGLAKGSLPTVWLGTLDKNGPAVPVKTRVVTAYGTLFMQLTSYKKE